MTAMLPFSLGAARGVSRKMVPAPYLANFKTFSTGVVPLTGCTLQAALKMRCDNSGAGYAIFWSEVNGVLVTAGSYTSDAHMADLKKRGLRSSFTESSKFYKLDAAGDGPIASVHQSKKPLFISEPKSWNMRREELVKQFGLQQICFIPFEDGVLEFGTDVGEATATWSEMPQVANLPKAAMRKGFENLGASYCMYWAKQGNEFKVTADYVTDSRKRLLKEVRNDDDTFCSMSRHVTIDAAGNGPIATAFREGKEVTVTDVNKMKRAELAKEFDIARVHFIPMESGVLEYGSPKNVFLKGDTLAASLKMRCDTSGAGYALYWQHSDGKLAVSGSYVTPARQAALAQQGFLDSFAEASRGYTLDPQGDGPVARVMKTREPVFIEDVVTCTDLKRGEVAMKYGIKSICIVPTPGGVIEYGTSAGPCTANWTCMDDARKAIMPKSELEKAFNAGATHIIFWHQVKDEFVVGASYITPERANVLKLMRGDDKSYTSESVGFKLNAKGQGPVSTAARSGTEIIIEDPCTEDVFLRKDLAKEFKIGQCHFVPCKDGVLEYGVGGRA